ncbi:hypothetical protein BRD01_08185 [Halobacteriales archaeon QS_8_65_32]|nr:MAG: hypothetical protein BRD01_08185 [Halobacteriales archaeon QS_8_65_32]
MTLFCYSSFASAVPSKGDCSISEARNRPDLFELEATRWPYEPEVADPALVSDRYERSERGIHRSEQVTEVPLDSPDSEEWSSPIVILEE